MEKELSVYSNNCSLVKRIANIKVKSKFKITVLNLFFNKAWWALVTVAPEVSKIKVFNKGTPHGLIISIPAGGHTPPILKTGDKLE